MAPTIGPMRIVLDVLRYLPSARNCPAEMLGLSIHNTLSTCKLIPAQPLVQKVKDYVTY
jgi:ribosomal protein L30/L7E